jgi:hypothetical protein
MVVEIVMIFSSYDRNGPGYRADSRDRNSPRSV